jgi:transposase
MKRYILNLSDDERAALEEIVRRNRISKLKLQRAQILLKADEGLTDVEISDELGVGTATVERIRKRAVLDGLEAALDRKEAASPSRPRKLDGRAEAHLVALACTDPPDGAPRWTLSLLGERLVELRIVDTVSRSTIHRSLKKTTSSPGR